MTIPCSGFPQRLRILRLTCFKNRCFLAFLFVSARNKKYWWVRWVCSGNFLPLKKNIVYVVVCYVTHQASRPETPSFYELWCTILLLFTTPSSKCMSNIQPRCSLFHRSLQIIIFFLGNTNQNRYYYTAVLRNGWSVGPFPQIVLYLQIRKTAQSYLGIFRGRHCWYDMYIAARLGILNCNVQRPPSFTFGGRWPTNVCSSWCPIPDNTLLSSYDIVAFLHTHASCLVTLVMST